MPDGSALLLATDGETFGHHKKHGAAELARAFITLERRDDIIVTSCEQYLASRPAEGIVNLPAPSSWSCPHGVDRWRDGCGCRMDSHTNQKWRAPLRDAMLFVNNHVNSVYDRFAPPLVKDPTGVLTAGIRVLIDSEPSTQEAFFDKFKVSDKNSRASLLRLLEMVRAGQATLTSCAWFFDDFGGPEGRVALRYAARAIELAAELTPSIESELLERLRPIRSNHRQVGDAATLYLSLKTREARGRV